MPELLSSRVSFSTAEEGRSLISESDVYTQNLTRFDLQAKIRTTKPVVETDYLRNARGFVRAWTQDEVTYLTTVIAQVHSRMLDLKHQVNLPEEIAVVKTTGWEEGGANGYTRSNVIYLNRNSLSPGLFRHELFHIISRFATDSKLDRIYGVLGFTPTAPILYEDDLRITNPDAPSLRHILAVRYRGEEIKVALVMRSGRAYTGGGFFPYVQKRLLVLEGGSQLRPRLIDGEPLLLTFEQVEGLYTLLGRNTAYTIHQEEVCAVHFQFLHEERKQLPHPKLITALDKVLCE